MSEAADPLLATAFIEEHPDEAAALLESAVPRDAVDVLAGCDAGVAARALSRMLPTTGGRCLEIWPVESLPDLLAALGPERASRLVRAIDPAERPRVLASAPPDIASTLEQTLHFPESTVGAIMDPAVFALAEDLAAGEAQRRIRGAAHPLRYYLYAIDRDGLLVGVVSLRELLLAPAHQTVKDLARPTQDHVSAWSTIDSAAKHPAWERLRALPVVDERTALLGVLGVESLPRERATSSVTLSPGPLGLELVHLYWLTAGSLLGRLAPAIASPGKATEAIDHDA